MIFGRKTLQLYLTLTESSDNLLNNVSLYRNRVDPDAQDVVAARARKNNAAPLISKEWTGRYFVKVEMAYVLVATGAKSHDGISLSGEGGNCTRL